MPLYEYKCLKCNRHFEVIQKFADSPIEKCTVCGGKVERLISPPAIHFKGSGWYVTDYARKGNPEKLKDQKREKELSPIKGSSNNSCCNSSPSVSTNKNSLNDSPAKK